MCQPHRKLAPSAVTTFHSLSQRKLGAAPVTLSSHPSCPCGPRPHCPPYRLQNFMPRQILPLSVASEPRLGCWF